MSPPVLKQRKSYVIRSFGSGEEAFGSFGIVAYVYEQWEALGLFAHSVKNVMF